MDIAQLVGVIGVPGALCVLLLRSFNELRKSIDGNTKVLYHLAGQMGFKLNEKDDERR